MARPDTYERSDAGRRDLIALIAALRDGRSAVELTTAQHTYEQPGRSTVAVNVG